jgi:hypothetical protein
MARVYSFSTSSDFGNAENVNLINTDITNLILDNTRLNTEIIGDSISITFESSLSPASLAVLQNIISTRDPPNNRGDKVITLYCPAKVKTDTFKIVARLPYKGWTITNIEVSSYMDPNSDGYTVRVYDPINDAIIAEKELSNISEELSDLGPVSNLSSSNAELEIQVKVTGNTGSKYVHIDNVLIYHS